MVTTEPSFIERDPVAITAAMTADYEAGTGRTLYPAQPESLLIHGFAYRENLVRIGIQEAALQNLVAYAAGDMLDYLGELVGCYRLEGESDDRFRERVQLGQERVAGGSVSAYRLAVLSVSTEITAVAVTSPADGVVNIAVTTAAEDAEGLLNRVRLALNADDARPLTDQVIVVLGGAA